MSVNVLQLFAEMIWKDSTKKKRKRKMQKRPRFKFLFFFLEIWEIEKIKKLIITILEVT